MSSADHKLKKGKTKMKKILIALAAAAALVGCRKVEDDKNIDDAWTNHGNACWTKIVEIEGHKYILMDGSYSGTLIHAASCWCMKK